MSFNIEKFSLFSLFQSRTISSASTLSQSSFDQGNNHYDDDDDYDDDDEM